MRPPPGAVLLGIAGAGVLAAVTAGLFLIGSPGQERARRIDDRRVEDLRAIAAAIDLYWTRHGRLPASLDELRGEPGVQIVTTDPDGAEGYGYQPVDSVRYEVCARFRRETEVSYQYPGRNLWAHGAGWQCFPLEPKTIRREIDLLRTPRVGPDTVHSMGERPG